MNGVTVHSTERYHSLCPPPGLAPTAFEDENPRFMPQHLVDRVRNILTALILAEHMEAFIANAPPGWRMHQLTGERKDQWSVSVSGSWRITFEEEDGSIDRLNLEDYH